MIQLPIYGTIKSIESKHQNYTKFNIGLGTQHGWMLTILCGTFKSPNMIPLWDCLELIEPV